MKDLIQGAKSGDDQRTPVEAQDNVRSKQVARILDILSEGEIVGLTNGLRSVFLNETPVQNIDGSFNFSDVSVQQRTGTVDQTPVDGVTGSEFEIAVGTEVKFDNPVVRSVAQANVKAVRVTLGFPQLTEQNLENGDLNGSTVSLAIQVQNNGGGFVTKAADIITAKTTSHYQRAYLIELTGEGPWDIKVVRETPDSTSSAVNNKFYWDSLTGIIPALLAYPNSALVHLTVDAANFTSIPNRAYKIRGLIIRVPTNYDPRTRTYNGIWDGTFKLAWTDNPAWCFYDLITNERYGLGQFISPDSIDKWALYAIAKYCDQLVPNGRGGMEPRFTCNLYLQSSEDAYKVVQNMASIFRAITFWASGTIVPMQDRPGDAVSMFTNANVEEGLFHYSGSSLKQRHTVALVSWNDPNDFYRQKTEYVQDDELVRAYGIIEMQVAGFGCSSQSQAHRWGKWALATERYCSETVGFRTGLEGCVLYPGAIIQTSDITRAGKRMGGRIVEFIDDGSSQQIVVDSPVDFVAGHTYRVTVVTTDGDVQTKLILNTINDPDHTRLILVERVTKPVQPGAIWVITDENNLVPEMWRVLSVTESGPGVVEITALNYVADLYDAVEHDIVIEAPPTSTINTRPPSPINFDVTVSHYRVDSQIAGLRALVSWTSNVGRYRLSWRKKNGQWQSKECTETSTEIDGVDAVTYDFMVVAISSVGRESSPARLTKNLGDGAVDAVDELPAPANLKLESAYVRSDAMFRWDSVPGALGYEVQLSRTAEPFNPLRTAMLGNVLRFTYSPDDMKADGGPFRSLTIRVRAYTVYGKTGKWATLTVGNPQVEALQGISVHAGIKTVFFECAEPDDLDFVGIMLWMDETPDFIPGPENQVYSGPGTYAVFNATASGDPFDTEVTYYLKAAGYDAIGKDNLNISGSFAVTVYNNAPDKDTIIAEMIKNGALDITKFADGIQPVGIVDALPPLDGPEPYTGPVTVLLGDKLYILKDGAWKPNLAEVGPGSITEGALDPTLLSAIERVTGPENTPGTIANELKQLSDFANEQIEYVGMLTETAIAAAKFAIRAQTTATQSVTTRANALVARLGENITAAVYEESQARATALQSIATQIEGLSTQWGADIDAKIQTYNETVSSEFSAQAKSISDLSTTVDGQTATIQETRESVDGVKARVEFKLNVDGVISGMALDSSTDRNGAPTSAAVFAEDIFQIKGTNTAATPIFEVDTRAGQEVIVMAGTVIKDGSITADAIAANAITAGKIAAGAISTEQLAADAITTDVIVIGTNGGIPGTMIKDGAILTEKLAADSVTGDKILANTIVAGNIATDAIETRHLAAESVTAGKIDARGLVIKDVNGNVILGANSPLDWANVKPLANLAALNGTENIKNSLVTINSDGTLVGGGGGKVTLSGVGYYGDPYATQNTGPFATLNGKITASIAASYFAANSISGTYISELVADKITAGTLGANVIYAGTVSANQINGGTITGVNINISNNFKVNAATGTSTLFVADLYRCNASNSDAPGIPALKATSAPFVNGSGPAIQADGGANGNAINITGGANGVVQSGGGANFLHSVMPTADNSYDLGIGSSRWANLYVASGAINTSDGRYKQQERTLTDAEHAVAMRIKGLLRAFKFNAAVEAKGDGARWHFGVIAQQVKAAFEAEGLVAEEYALLCYDEWDEQPAEMGWVGEPGEEVEVVLRPAVPAGNRYGIRYDELLAFMIAAL